MTIPEKLQKIIDELINNNFHPYIVGGYVRDSISGLDPKDIDIEVLGCSISQLEQILSKFGSVDAVGKKFGILKLGNEFDFSVPRRENKIGVGHKDFLITFDPTITDKEAAARRDFTWNALCYNCETHEIIDHFGGIDDLNNKILRHTSEQFNEDPLRVLRAMQFQGRMGFELHPDTVIEMNKMVEQFNSCVLDEETLEKFPLPVERISEEFMKWAKKSKQPDLIFDFLYKVNLRILLPEIYLMDNIKQDTLFHPEIMLQEHNRLCLQQMVKICDRENITGEDRAVLMLTILLHDLGKITTTREEFVEKHGRVCITSKGHEEESAVMALPLLQRIGIKQEMIDRIIPLIKNHLAFVNIFHLDSDRPRKSALLRLSRRLHPATIGELLLVFEADFMGRGLRSDETIETFLERLEAKKKIISEISIPLNIVHNARKSFLMGRHLIELGLVPGPIFGEILRTADEAQDNLEFTDLDEAKIWLQNYLTKN